MPAPVAVPAPEPGTASGQRAPALVAALAWRYLRGRRSLLLQGTARAALAATGLGVAAMVVAMALMSGYTEELQRKIRASGAIIAYPQTSVAPAPAVSDIESAASAVDGVRAVQPVVFAQGSLESDAVPQGLDVIVRGIEPGRPVLAGGLEGAAFEFPVLPPTGEGPPSVLLGRDLANRLAAAPGDNLRLVVVDVGGRSPDFKYRTVRFAGDFATGFAEYDRHWLVLDRRVAAEMSGNPGLYEIAVDEGAVLRPVRRALEQALGDAFLVTDWEPHNRQLFQALQLQKLVLFLILGLIVLVSTFNVASTLVVMVRERLKEVGVLGAMGMRPRQLEAIFVVCGTTLGGVGILLGVGVGSLISWALTTFHLIRFDSEVAAIYFINWVPFRVRLWDLLAVAAFSLVVTLAACWLPARRVARLDPAEALSYE